jgi:hypothetical protein
MRRLAAILGVAIAATIAGCKSSPSGASGNGAPLQLEWHLAAAKPRKGYTEMTYRDEPRTAENTVWVDPRPILRLSDIANAAKSKTGDPWLYLDIKVAARVGFQAETGSHVKDLLVLLMNGQIVCDATLESSLSRQVPVRIGTGGITDAEADAIMDAVRRSGGK